MASRCHLLIFEPDSRGHNEEWLGHLLYYLPDLKAVDALTLAVAPELASRLQPQTKTCPIPLKVIALDKQTLVRCNGRRLIVSAFTRWWVMRGLVRVTGADTVLLLALDHLSLPLGLQLGTRGCRLSGILFRPSVHYATFGAYKPSLAERLRDLRKDLLYRLMLRNSSVASVLSLDPFFAAYAAAHYYGGEKVHSLADPFRAPGKMPDKGPSATSSPTRTRFLLFGELTERKGLLVLLEALARLDPESSEKIAITIAGRIDPPIRSRAQTLAAEVTRRVPAVMLQIEDRWLSEQELTRLVRESDVVLAPYQRFVGSSGVLIWAAAFRKPVLSQDFGLLGHLVRSYRLGHTLDTRDPSLLARSLSAIATTQKTAFCDPSGTEAFLAGKTPRAFVETLVRGIGEIPAGIQAHA